MNCLSIEKLRVGVAGRELIDFMPVEFWKEKWMMRIWIHLKAGGSRGVREQKDSL